jgi:tight adherence protein B
LLYARERRAFDIRVAEMGADPETREMVRRSILLQFGDRIDRTGWARRMKPRLEIADLNLMPSEWLAAVVTLAVSLYLGAQIAFQTSWYVNAGFMMLGTLVLPRTFLRSRRNHYLLRFEAQMPEVATLISNSLRAGLSVPQAFGEVMEKTEPPAGVEFGRLSREIRLGTRTDEAMARMLGQLPSDELRLMFTTIAIQRRTGGNLVHALQVMAEAISARFKLKDEVRTMTAEARFTGLILVVLPIVTLIMINRVLPGSVASFLSAPLGWLIALLFGGMIGLAFFLIQRASRIRV